MRTLGNIRAEKKLDEYWGFLISSSPSISYTESHSSKRSCFQRKTVGRLHWLGARKMTLEIFSITLMLSILLCSLVAGLMFGFAVVVMPGIAKLPDRDYLISFKQMDGIIQNNQPAFMLVWIGSVVSIIVASILGVQNLVTSQTNLLWLALGFYLLGVQLPTARFNIPLNNALQNMDLMTSEASELATFRLNFETQWNRWNRFRVFNAIVSVMIMIFLLSQL